LGYTPPRLLEDIPGIPIFLHYFHCMGYIVQFRCSWELSCSDALL
jgi:hypothetical protein